MAERNLGYGCFFHFIRKNLRHISLNKARRNRIDADAAGRQFPCRCFRQADHTCFRCRIICLSGVSCHADHRSHVDDAAALLTDHRPCRKADAVERSLEVCLNDTVEGFLRHAHQKAVLCDTRVVDQNIDFPIQSKNFLRPRFTRRKIRYIALHHAAVSSCRADSRKHGFGRLFRTIVIDDNKGSLRRQFFCNRTPDSAGCARYYCCFST